MDVEGKLYFPTTLMASAHGNFGVSKNNYSISIPSKQTNKQIGGEMKGNELILVPQAVLLCSCGPGETARASCLLDALSTPGFTPSSTVFVRKHRRNLILLYGLFKNGQAPSQGKLSPLCKTKIGLTSDSVRTCSQACRPEFDFSDPHHGKRGPTPMHLPPTAR